MERKLKQLFDYQRFEKNPKLEKMIQKAVGTRSKISDNSAAQLSAAGNPEISCAGGDAELIKKLETKKNFNLSQ